MLLVSLHDIHFKRILNFGKGQRRPQVEIYLLVVRPVIFSGKGDAFQADPENE